jgi:cell division protein FtsQ
MNKVKKVLLAVVTTVCCVTVLVGGVWCSRQVDSSLCTQVEVLVEDSLSRQYVDVTELEMYLKSRGCYALDKVMSTVDCHRIEQTLLEHDMIRTASCYTTPFGAVHVRVTQRIPVLCVKTAEGNYLVDSDRRVMPYRSGMKLDLPVFTGAISQRAATEEYFDFVMWLKSNSYWNTRISDVYVRNPKMLVLSQTDYSAKIVLGKLDGYEAKLSRLRNLYKKGFDILGYPECRELDLRFSGQVVRR